MTATDTWDVLVDRFSARTASMNAILADSEGWRKWCEENPEKCAYQPKGGRQRRISPIKGTEKVGPLDATMSVLDAKTQGKVEAQWKKLADGDSPADVERHLDQVYALATPEQIEEGKQWYPVAHGTAVGLDEKYDLEPGVSFGVIAAMSPGKDWDSNVEQAEQLIAFVRAHPEIESREDMALAAIHENHWSVAYGRDPFHKAIDIARGGDPDTVLSGTKVRSFYNNIYDPKGEHGAANDVTVDTHMFNAAFGGTERLGPSGVFLEIRKPKGAPSDWEPVQVPGADFVGRKGVTTSMTGTPKSAERTIGVYPLIADKIRTIAQRERLLPNEVQAIMWVVQRNLHPPVEAREASKAIIKLTEAKYAPKAASCDDCGAVLADLEETARERWARWDAEHPREKKGREKRAVEPAALNAMREALRTEGGFTINPRTGTGYDTGFSAAIPNHSKIISEAEFFADDDTAENAIADWIKDNAEVFDADPELNFGGWIDTENGEVVLDPSKHFDDEAEAIQRGVEWDQQEIWDHKNKVGIKTGGTGQRVASCSECHGPITADTAGWRKWCEENPEKCGGEAKAKEEIPGEQELFDTEPFTFPGPHLKDVVPTPPEFTAWEREEQEIADEVAAEEAAEEFEAEQRSARALEPIMEEDPDAYIPKAGALPSWTPDLAVEFMRNEPLHFDDEGIDHIAERLRAAQEQREQWINEVAGEEWRQEEIRQSVVSYLTEGRVVTRVHGEVLQEILSDGEWETQFTTGTSGGTYNPEIRTQVEGLYMGVGMDEYGGRPVYATWMTPSTDPDLTSQYGNVEVILKRDVESRATVSLLDSLGTETFPQPFSVMRNGSLRQQMLADMPNPQVLSEIYDNGEPSGYTEVQIRGGLKTAWIEHVVFRESNVGYGDGDEETTQAMLDDAGIPWSIIPDYDGENQYPVDWRVPSEARAAGLRRGRDQRAAVGCDDPDHHRRQTVEARVVRGAHERRGAASVGSCDECHGPITADTEGWRRWCEANPEKCGGGAEAGSRDVSEQAQLLAAEAKQIEPAVTAMMQGLASRHGGELVGLEHRLKEESGLARKIRDDMEAKGVSAADAAKGVSDSVRYTVQFAPDQYAGSTEAALAEMRASGFGVRVKNFWAKGDPYNGVNAKMQDPKTGREIEVQFHTAESLVAKDETHPMFATYRVLPKTDPERAVLWDRMVTIADSQPFPQGLERIGPLMQQPQ